MEATPKSTPQPVPLDAKIALHFSAACILFPSVLFTLGWFRLLFEQISASTALAGAVLCSTLSLVLGLSKLPGVSNRQIAVSILCYFLLLLITALGATLVLDTSFDGQMYHQEAMLQLAQGWNPLEQMALPLERIGEQRQRLAFLLTHYPKGYWLAAAQIYEAFNQLETAKALSLVLASATFFGAYSLLRSQLPSGKIAAFFSALLITLSPIVSAQFFTYYLDSAIASLLFALIAVILLWLQIGGSTILVSWLLGVVLLINYKFTCLVYVALLLAAMACWSYCNARPRCKTLIATSVLACVLGVAVFGAQPYLYNQKEHGSLIYPVTPYPLSGVTPKEESLIVDQLPLDFVEANRFEKLARSMFARSENLYRPQQSTRKYPWTIRFSEITAFKDPDVRLGGFGPLFALPLLGAGIVGLCLLLQHQGYQRFWPLWFFSGVLTASVLINPEAWWARYVPQLWLLPIAILHAAVYLHKNWIVRRLALACMLLLCINAALVLASSLHYQILTSRAQKAQLTALPKDIKYRASYDLFYANRIRLKEFGIQVIDSGDVSCAKPILIPYSLTTLCPAH